MARREWTIATTVIAGAVVAILLFFLPAPAVADDVAPPEAAASIEELLKAGKLAEAEAIGAAAAKEVAATPKSLAAADTVTFASALSDRLRPRSQPEGARRTRFHRAGGVAPRTRPRRR
jgi:hypothetical protein